MSKTYGNDSISSLKGAERVRQRPEVIFGTSEIEGVQHAYFEIISNSVDEAKDGHGKVIISNVYTNGVLEVVDEGRGIPLEWNDKEDRYNWDLVFNELYSGGKFDKGDKYQQALGLNGLGATATQYTSEFFEAHVTRDGFEYSVRFEKGLPIDGKGKSIKDTLKSTRKVLDTVLNKKPTKNKKTGSRIRWKSDPTVFKNTVIPDEYFLGINKLQAVANEGIKFIVNYYEEDMKTLKETHEFHYPEGIVQYVKEVNGDNGLTDVISGSFSGRGRDGIKIRKEDVNRDISIDEYDPEYNVEFKFAMAFNNYVNEIKYFHNSSLLENGGSPDKAIKAALVAAFDKEIKSQKKYTAKESKISFNDLVDSLIVVTTSFSDRVSYENQTKKAISNKFVQDFATTNITEMLRVWMIENKKEATRVIDQILANKRSREQADKSRLDIRKKLTQKAEGIGPISPKFVDCRSKDKNIRELFIVEGDSAKGATKDARNKDFQAIMPIRGKILNCLKASYSQIFKSEIIIDLIKIIGCGVEVETKSKKAELFDYDKLKWDKIIIMTDADVDGFQIRTLLLAMFYKLMPTLIEKGHVYIAETPLYEVQYKDNKNVEHHVYAFDDKELDVILKKAKGTPHIQRSKGLGENDPQMMWDTTLNPETRHLIKVVPDNFKRMNEKYLDENYPEYEMEQALEIFLGDDLNMRRDYIEKYAYLFEGELDD